MSFGSILETVLTITFSLIIGYFFVDYLRDKMSNVAPVNEASEYLEKSSVKIRRSKDVYLYTHKSRRKKD